MAIVGIVCMEDGSYQSFDHCIHKHECFEANCPALTFAIKLQRDNMKHRKDAGISASTLLSCPRTVGLLTHYDYYEPVADGWVKSMGTIIHSMIESDPDDLPNRIRERRIKKEIEVDGEWYEVTGQPDDIDTFYKVVIDYKTKESLPTKADAGHEYQFNVYAWLCDGGTFTDNGERIDVKIERGGMHYVTRKSSNPFKKIGYPIWPTAKTEEMIRQRLRPIIEFRKTDIIPEHNPYQTFGGNWKCDCIKIQKQLEERGIEVHDHPADRYAGQVVGGFE